ncbi:MAG: hypothetical protein AAF889_10265 [Cyanobacteria bacterium P01_D01_bin.73]
MPPFSCRAGLERSHLDKPLLRLDLLLFITSVFEAIAKERR